MSFKLDLYFCINITGSPTGTPIVTLLAGDIGQSGLVPGRAPVHSISTFYVPGNIVVTNPPPWAPLEGGSKVPKYLPSAGRPGGGSDNDFSENFFSKLPTLFAQCSAPHISLHIASRYIAQVYTRDATHRPTATSTPGRGTFL